MRGDDSPPGSPTENSPSSGGSRGPEENSTPPCTPASSPYIYPDYDDDEDEDDDDDDENLLKIVVETLTGTTFHVRVSPWETGAGLKGLLQQTQGLPASHQHILLGQTELTDEAPLIDQGVQDGACLRLVLAMKGGPLNTSRVPPYDDSLWRDFTDFMDVNKEELWGGEPGRPVTLLVIREENAVNLYQVVENEDGSFSPLNESWTSHRSCGSGKTDRSSSKESLLDETLRHQQRMAELNAQMEALNIRRKENKEKKRKRGSSKPSSPRVKMTVGTRTQKRRVSLSHSQKLKREVLASGDEAPSVPSVRGKGGVKSAAAPSIERPSVTLSAPRPVRLPPVKPSTSRLGLNRSLSTPSRQEGSSEVRRPSVSRGSRVLGELPQRIQQPRQVEFSQYTKLDSIRPLGDRRGSLHTLQEDAPQLASGTPLAGGKEEGESGHRFDTYPETLVRHSKQEDLREDPPQGFRHAWSGRDAPLPFYNSDSAPRRRSYVKPRLNHSYNVGCLHPPRDFDRPKTSPEILGGRPLSAATCSSTSERIHLRAPDDKLKELINILNLSRTSSRQSDHSSEGPLPSHRKGNPMSEGFPKGRNRSRRHSGYSSLSTSFVSLRGSPPPSASSTSGGFRRAFPNLGSQDRLDALRDALKSQPSISRRSTPEGGHRVFRRPTSGQFKAVATPKRKSKKLRPRCQKCQKKLGLATSYTCRCGHMFCAQHRYAETHNCSYDYKATGKKLIEMANPLVVPPKLPKI